MFCFIFALFLLFLLVLVCLLECRQAGMIDAFLVVLVFEFGAAGLIALLRFVLTRQGLRVVRWFWRRPSNSRLVVLGC